MKNPEFHLRLAEKKLNIYCQNSQDHEIKMNKKFVNTLGRLLAILSLVFLIKRLLQHFDELPQLSFNFFVLAIITFSIVFTLIFAAINAYITLLLLRKCGTLTTFTQIYIITGQSQIAKYLPGNIFHYFGQIALGRKAGIPPQKMVLSLGIQTGILVSTAMSVALCGLCFDRNSFSWIINELQGRNPYFFLLLISVFLIVTVFVISSLLPKTRTWFLQYLRYLSPSRMSMSAVLYGSVFVGYGIMISLLLRVLGKFETLPQWYHFTWGFALAWVLGFIVPGAPGGIGIREVILFGLFRQELGTGTIIGLSLLLRVITSFGDLVTFGIALCLERFGKRLL